MQLALLACKLHNQSQHICLVPLQREGRYCPSASNFPGRLELGKGFKDHFKVAQLQGYSQHSNSRTWCELNVHVPHLRNDFLRFAMALHGNMHCQQNLIGSDILDNIDGWEHTHNQVDQLSIIIKSPRQWLENIVDEANVDTLRMRLEQGPELHYNEIRTLAAQLHSLHSLQQMCGRALVVAFEGIPALQYLLIVLIVECNTKCLVELGILRILNILILRWLAVFITRHVYIGVAWGTWKFQVFAPGLEVGFAKRLQNEESHQAGKKQHDLNIHVQASENFNAELHFFDSEYVLVIWC